MTERLCSDSTTLVENSTLCPAMSRNTASELHTYMLAVLVGSSPGHSQILSRSRGELRPGIIAMSRARNGGLG